MKLKHDTTASRALRVALEDDPMALPSAQAMERLAAVIEWRINEPEPVRLSKRADTPPALREAILVNSRPERSELNDVWKALRKVVLADSRIQLRSTTTPCVPNWTGKPDECTKTNIPSNVRWFIPLPSRSRRNIGFVVAGIVTVSTLAAAGFELLSDTRASTELKERLTPSNRSEEKPFGQRRYAPLKTLVLPLPSAGEVSSAVPEEPRHELSTNSAGGGRGLALRGTLSSKSSTKVPTSKDAVAALSTRESSVVTESNLLRTAWASLRAGHPQDALTAVREHATRYPQGALNQEREIVEIRALEQLGRFDEAQRKAAIFASRFPDSPHQPLVNSNAD